jgi:hypothetical protein
MDPSSPFKSEVFRPITGLLIPGLIAGLPYALVLGSYFPDLTDYRDKHEIVYFTIASLLVIGLGFILEDVGTELEMIFDVWLVRGKHPDLHVVWFEYLALKFNQEPVGQRYLRSLVLRLKFELSAGVSLLLSFPGIVWLSVRKDLFAPCALMVLGLVFIGIAAYLFHQSYKGAAALANVRRVLVGKSPILP